MSTVVRLELVHEECCNCGVSFGLTADYFRRKKDNGGTFHCPNGHPQHYTTSTVQELQAKLDAAETRAQAIAASRDLARMEADHERRRAAAQKGHRTRLRNRIAAGVCPCCNRTFANVHRHIASQHPGFATPDLDDDRT